MDMHGFRHPGMDSRAVHSLARNSLAPENLPAHSFAPNSLGLPKRGRGSFYAGAGFSPKRPPFPFLRADELAAYVQRHVSAVAQQRFDAPQRPQRLGLPADDDHPPIVCRVRPQSLKRTLADLADQVAVQLEIHRQPRVGVLEFTTETGAGEVLGADFGVLGRYCGGELQQQLLTRNTGRFDVADRRRMDQALKEAKFKIGDLGSESALKDLGQRAGKLPVVAVGTLVERDGRTVTLRCQLLRTNDSSLVAQTTVRAKGRNTERRNRFFGEH
jgi:hypothetical protein